VLLLRFKVLREYCPQITTLQRDAIAAPATGLTIFNTTAVCLQWYRYKVGYDPTLVLLLQRIWMDRNLGVDQGLNINTITSDFRFYGSLYQWGRASDGHEIIGGIVVPLVRP
jgi:hypothetical protein